MEYPKGIVVAACTSEKTGIRKTPVPTVELRQAHGIVGDAHAGPWHRQVSLLAMESIRKMQAMGLNVGPGDFAENITTEGIDIKTLPVGTWLTCGNVLLEITQIGKVCHARCAIYHQAGDCVMPKEGVFARVLRGGTITSQSAIEVLECNRAQAPGKAEADLPASTAQRANVVSLGT
jgi:MOSC domain-containing protein YiiM